jgi:ferredoxin/flavodoxin---NADP+ reductase
VPHVITASCCGDASCVYACPVNCIHPGPNEPGFATAEMLYIDPLSCVDCAACVSACPVGAIVADTRLTPDQRPFAAVNAAHYPPRPPGHRPPPADTLAPVPPAPRVRPGPAPLRVAVVGSGPAGMYAADELLTAGATAVSVFDALPTPYGLVRSGVAPDHPNTKAITGLFDRISDRRGFDFFLNVDVGAHISHAELLEYHHAALYAVGAAGARTLDVAGMDLPGTGAASDLAAWLNGHPHATGPNVDLDHPRAVVIGNGNVALDVARVLTADPDDLAATDISDRALEALRRSAVREVVVAARRGPAESAFTLPELIGLCGGGNVVLDPADRDLVRADLAVPLDAATRAKLELLAGVPGEVAAARRIRLVYRLVPERVLGTSRVTGVSFRRARAGGAVTIDTGLLLTSVGHRGTPVVGLPFDAAAGVVPSTAGRVIDPDGGRPVRGAYVAGWIKRGPTGFIGTNKTCAMQTVSALVDDYNAGLLADPPRPAAALRRLLARRSPEHLDADGWRAIDAAESARGRRTGRPRVKFTTVPELLAAAESARARHGRRARR